MSAKYNALKTTGVTGAHFSSAIGMKEPVAHPKNCKTECPYGYTERSAFLVWQRL